MSSQKERRNKMPKFPCKFVPLKFRTWQGKLTGYKDDIILVLSYCKNYIYCKSIKL